MSFKLLKTILEFSLVYKIFEKENKEKKNVAIPERALQAVHPPSPHPKALLIPELCWSTAGLASKGKPHQDHLQCDRRSDCPQHLKQ